MVSVCASVNLSLHHKAQKLSSCTGSPGWSRKKGCKMVVVCGTACIFSISDKDNLYWHSVLAWLFWVKGLTFLAIMHVVWGDNDGTVSVTACMCSVHVRGASSSSDADVDDRLSDVSSFPSIPTTRWSSSWADSGNHAMFMYSILVMVTLCNRADHYIFALWFVSFFFFLLSFFPRLISAAVDWMSAILLHMVWP